MRPLHCGDLVPIASHSESCESSGGASTQRYVLRNACHSFEIRERNAHATYRTCAVFSSLFLCVYMYLSLSLSSSLLLFRSLSLFLPPSLCVCGAKIAAAMIHAITAMKIFSARSSVCVAPCVVWNVLIKRLADALFRASGC